ncbi:MAG: hypothetical protein RLZZ618_2617 [Pseudomonadota bacterium]|jgi:hypothetical protein
MLAPAHRLSTPPIVTAQLSYLALGETRPVSYAFEPPAGTPWESAVHLPCSVPVNDTRGVRTAIEREGFELRDAPTQVRNFLDEHEVRQVYHAEASELALAVTGAQHAFVFDHLVRKRSHGSGELNFGRSGVRGQAAANGRIHNDYTEASGAKRLELVLGDEAACRKVRRFSIVNVWRSIKAPVLDTPLALLDARSLSARDLVVGEVRYPNRTGEIYQATPSPWHRWSYFSAMDCHEVLIFKQYDSQLSGMSRFTLHAAFDHPHAPADAVPRESIELRCLVTYD